MIVYERAIRFEEIDAAHIVFFGVFSSFIHEAMEHFFGALEGGYSRLVGPRGTGMPTVNLQINFSFPARYGETLRIETSVTHVGNRSATFRHRMMRKDDGMLYAEALQKVVTSDLAELKSNTMPADVRALFLAHLEAQDDASAP